MSLYTTPLQFGYFLALLFAILLWYRGWQEERLSDKFLGVVMFFVAMTLKSESTNALLISVPPTSTATTWFTEMSVITYRE